MGKWRLVNIPMGRIWDLIVSNASLDSNSSWINRRTPQLQPFKNATTVALNEYVRHGWSPKKGDLQHSPGLPNYDSSSKFSQDQPGILLQQLQGLQGWTLGVQEACINFQAWANSHSPDMISWYLNREEPKTTGISSVHHAYCDFGDFCNLLFKKSWGHLQFLPPQQNYFSSLNLTKGQVWLRNDGHKRLHILQDNQKPGE